MLDDAKGRSYCALEGTAARTTPDGVDTNRQNHATRGDISMTERTHKRAPGTEMRKPTRADLMTVEDVMEELGIGRDKAYRLVSDGILPKLPNLGQRVIIPRAAFEAYIVAGTPTNGTPRPS